MDEEVYDVVTDLGFDIARIGIVPETSKQEGVLDEGALDDLKSHLDVLMERGIKKIFYTVWSPPGYMKKSHGR